jgi:pimeloyl-ACP methyl ester carboxylesterase
MEQSARTYSEELVYAHTEDGVLLAGVLTSPSSEPASRIAIVFIHGRPVSAFIPMMSGHARELASHGCSILTANTRGHDIGTWLFRKDGKLMLGGAWWEKLEDSPRDLDAWITFALGLGFRGVVLLGFSMGALKVINYQAERNDPRVVGLIAMSGPIRAAREMKPERVKLAEQMVNEGRGLDLLPWEEYGSPFGTMSAQGYLSRARANLDVFGVDLPDASITKIRCPLFVCYGTREEDIGTPADLEMIRRNAASASSIRTQVFEGAEHGFVGHEREVAVAFADWIGGVIPA